MGELSFERDWVVTRDDIELQCKASFSYEPDMWQSLIRELFTTLGKQANIFFCCFIGRWEITKSGRDVSHMLTSTEEELRHYVMASSFNHDEIHVSKCRREGMGDFWEM